ncbi:MAG: hypothetical protein AAGI17_07185 [Planctomycetota bacterium]
MSVKRTAAMGLLWVSGVVVGGGAIVLLQRGPEPTPPVESSAEPAKSYGPEITLVVPDDVAPVPSADEPELIAEDAPSGDVVSESVVAEVEADPELEVESRSEGGVIASEHTASVTERVVEPEPIETAPVEQAEAAPSLADLARELGGRRATPVKRREGPAEMTIGRRATLESVIDEPEPKASEVEVVIAEPEPKSVSTPAPMPEPVAVPEVSADLAAEEARKKADELGDIAVELIERSAATPIQSLSSSITELQGIVSAIGGLRQGLEQLQPQSALDTEAAKLDGLADTMRDFQASSLELHRRLLMLFKESVERTPEERAADSMKTAADDRAKTPAPSDEPAPLPEQ